MPVGVNCILLPVHASAMTSIPIINRFFCLLNYDLGKIVYSQACWLLALTDFAALLIKVGREEDACAFTSLILKSEYNSLINGVSELLNNTRHPLSASFLYTLASCT